MPPLQLDLITNHFASLRHRNYQLFWTGRFISQLGTWVQNTAMMWALYDITGSPLQLGLNGLFRALPAIGLGVFAGTLADRFERRRIILLTDATLFFMPLILGVLAQLGQLEPWHIYVVTLITSLVDSLGAPARQALYPNLVPIDALANAIALNSMLRRASTLIGPALAGILLGFTGIAGAFYANSASYLGPVITVLMMKGVTSRGGLKRGRMMKGFKEGLLYIKSDPILLSVVILEAFTSLFGINQVFLTVFAKDVLQVGPSGLGFMFSLRGVGGILGSMGVIYLSRARPQGTILMLSSLMLALSFAGFGFARHFSVALFFLVLLGLVDTISGASRSILLQTRTEDQMRGRANSIFQMMGRSLTPLGHTQAGLLIPLLGARGTVHASVLVILVSMLTINFFYPQLKRLTLTST
jgi:MFS family permease